MGVLRIRARVRRHTRRGVRQEMYAVREAARCRRWARTLVLRRWTQGGRPHPVCRSTSRGASGADRSQIGIPDFANSSAALVRLSSPSRASGVHTCSTFHACQARTRKTVDNSVTACVTASASVTSPVFLPCMQIPYKFTIKPASVATLLSSAAWCHAPHAIIRSAFLLHYAADDYSLNRAIASATFVPLPFLIHTTYAPNQVLACTPTYPYPPSSSSFLTTPMQLEALLNDNSGSGHIPVPTKRTISVLYSDGYITPTSPRLPNPRLAVEYLTTSPTSQADSSPSLSPQPVSLPLPLPLPVPFQTFHTSGSTSVAPASRLARSRVVGRRHRRNEQARLAKLESDVHKLRAENEALLAQADSTPVPMDVSGMVSVYIPGSGYSAHARESQFLVSSSTAKILGTGAIEVGDALALLELIALRRNLISTCTTGSGIDTGSSAQPTIECPDPNKIEQAVRNATPNGPLRLFHGRWSEHEGQASVQSYTHINTSASANSSTNINHIMTLQPTPLLKKCSRCGKVRAGHAKQVCADGHNIASLIPYHFLPFSPHCTSSIPSVL